MQASNSGHVLPCLARTEIKIELMFGFLIYVRFMPARFCLLVDESQIGSPMLRKLALLSEAR
jgi:hypothetical protein